jgi:hypothetical protein
MVPRLQLPGFQFLDRLAFGVRILALQFGRLLREVVFEHLQRHRLSMFVALLAVVCLWSYYNTIVPAFIVTPLLSSSSPSPSPSSSLLVL